MRHDSAMSTCYYYYFLVVGVAALGLVGVAEAGIECFECDSSRNFTCTEFWDPTLPVTAKYLTNCEHVYKAAYCVKMVGIFDGKLGTKRFCSSRTWGNYCEYIKRPGDIQEYRSCVFSCTTHGCNAANTRTASVVGVLAAVLTVAVGSRANCVS